MSTKTDEEKAREAYKQELLHCSNWKLRKRGVSAGVPVMQMKAAEAKGPEDMIDLILEKYDEGWRPGGEALNAPTEKPKPAPAKKRSSKPKAEAEPAPEPEPEPETEPEPEPEPAPQEEEAVDPWDQPVETETGEEDDALLSELGLDEELEEEPLHPDADEMMATTPPPREEPFGEVSGLEDKVDQIQDLLTDVAGAVVEINDRVKALEARLTDVHLKVTEHKEIAVRAWALLCKKVGVGNLSAALKKGSEKAESLLRGNGK